MTARPHADAPTDAPAGAPADVPTDARADDRGGQARRAGGGADARGLTIGALAARTGVTAETIRYYERVGVLPRAARGAAAQQHAGYRRYGAADVERLAFIRRARDLGFSLDEVRELLSLAGDAGHSCEDVDRLARAHLAQVEGKLAQLGALRAELVRVIGDCRGGRAVGDCRILGALGAPAAAAP